MPDIQADINEVETAASLENTAVETLVADQTVVAATPVAPVAPVVPVPTVGDNLLDAVVAFLSAQGYTVTAPVAVAPADSATVAVKVDAPDSGNIAQVTAPVADATPVVETTPVVDAPVVDPATLPVATPDATVAVPADATAPVDATVPAEDESATEDATETPADESAEVPTVTT